MRRALVVIVVGCHPAATPPPAPAAELPPPVVFQVKTAAELAAPTAVAPYVVGSAELRIDGRVIPVAGDGPLDAIGHAFARVPRELRDQLQTLAISPVPSPYDAYFRAKYKLPVQAGMSTGSHGDITIYPYGLEELRGKLGERRARSTAGGSAQVDDDAATFVKNFMHELGHAWSRIAWARDASAKSAWLAAIASDPSAPSEYARISYKRSGAPDEDAAEATALFFLERDTPRFAAYRAAMPKRFELIARRFAIILR